MIFYDISYKEKLCLDMDLGNDWESISCPEDEGHRRAGRRITDLNIQVRSRKIVDFSWTMMSDVVITDRALHVLRNNRLTGFEVKPAIITSSRHRMDRQRLPKFWELIVIGQAGHANPDSGIYLKWKCEACGLVRYSAYENGIIVDEKNWDGSDFSYVVGYPKHILVTERTKNIIESNHLTNVVFTPSNKLKWPELVIKP